MSVRPAKTLKLPASVVTIGAFDGVHRGHQALIRRAKDRAVLLGVPAVVYTFDPPPRAFFQAALILMPPAEKLRRLEGLGVNHVVLASFDTEYATRGPQAFLDELEALSPREVWVGCDFRFGGRREGGSGGPEGPLQHARARAGALWLGGSDLFESGACSCN